MPLSCSLCGTVRQLPFAESSRSPFNGTAFPGRGTSFVVDKLVKCSVLAEHSKRVMLWPPHGDRLGSRWGNELRKADHGHRDSLAEHRPRY